MLYCRFFPSFHRRTKTSYWLTVRPVRTWLPCHSIHSGMFQICSAIACSRIQARNGEIRKECVLFSRVWICDFPIPTIWEHAQMIGSVADAPERGGGEHIQRRALNRGGGEGGGAFKVLCQRYPYYLRKWWVGIGVRISIAFLAEGWGAGVLIRV